jgi:hypothetical protein
MGGEQHVRRCEVSASAKTDSGVGEEILTHLAVRIVRELKVERHEARRWRCAVHDTHVANGAGKGRKGTNESQSLSVLAKETNDEKRGVRRLTG